MNHPLQLMLTVLVAMGLCVAAGVCLAQDNFAWFWGLLFASLLIFAFGVMTPHIISYRRYRGYY